MIRTLFHRHHHDEPCPHMERLLHAAAEGKGNKFTKWYVLAHTARCGPCLRFLRRLEIMLTQLAAAKADNPSDEVSARLLSQFQTANEDSDSR